jgi:hypothetical protein
MLSRLIPCALALVLVSCKQRALPSGEVHVKAERIAASKSRTPADIAPYDEALAWHEYKVRSVIAGRLKEKKIRVAHWTVVKGQAVSVSNTIGETAALRLRPYDNAPALDNIPRSDDLETDLESLPRFLDIGQQMPAGTAPKATRMDYGGNFSNAMKLYWMLRPQLRLVVMGNSHGAKDVCPQMFWQEENEKTPIAFNLTPAGSNNHMQCELVRQYVLPLPKLEWLVWVVSPRNFNRLREDNRKMQEFFSSPGYLYDQKNHASLWPVPTPPKPVTYEEVKAVPVEWIDPWGWEGRQKSLLDHNPAIAKPGLIKDLNKPYFELDERALGELQSALQEASKKVRVLVLSTPNHPFSNEAEAPDPDNTSHEGRREFVKALIKMDGSLDRVWFRDFHEDGKHDFTHEEFYDADHLNRPGSRKLTDKIISWMNEVSASAPGEK